MKARNLLLAVFCAAVSFAQIAVETVAVTSKTVEKEIMLPGELLPYLHTDIYAKVTGFVEKVEVDRGSVVKAGSRLAILSAPELASQLAEAESKVAAVESQRAEAAAKLMAAQSTYQGLKTASETPGAVAGNDLIVAGKAVDAAQSSVSALADQVKAARSAVAALRDLEGYLVVTAPFDGIITERDVHPGALVGPAGEKSSPLLKIEQIARLRLTVAVPEADVGGLVKGARVSFTVPAYPGQTFSGVVSRVAHSIDMKTRTMPVELDVGNPGLKLSPGMYPEVRWPVRRTRPSLLVPISSIVTTTERSFVIRIRGGVAEWVSVTRGSAAGDMVEVYGTLQAGDVIVRRGSDELREGTRVQTVSASR